MTQSATTTATAAAPSAAELDAARLLLARLGVAPADLLRPEPDRAPAPTFAEYVPVARAYAGHIDSNSHAGTTATYVRAQLPEVATALAALTAEHHPLADSGHDPG
jgi:hypothetical protein